MLDAISAGLVGIRVIRVVTGVEQTPVLMALEFENLVKFFMDLALRLAAAFDDDLTPFLLKLSVGIEELFDVDMTVSGSGCYHVD